MQTVLPVQEKAVKKKKEREDEKGWHSMECVTCQITEKPQPRSNTWINRSVLIIKSELVNKNINIPAKNLIINIRYVCLLCQRHWDQVAQKSLSSRFFIPTSLPNYTLIIHSQLLFKVFSFYIQGPTFSRTEVQCRFCWCKGEYNVSKLKWKKFIYEILSQERVNSCCRLGLLCCL